MLAQGARASASEIGRLLRLTGGLPLYVSTAAQLSTSQYGGDIGAMCSSVEAQTNIVSTAQELILARLFDALPENVRDCAAVLSLSDVPLGEGEAKQLIKRALAVEATGFAAAVRQLRHLGVLRLFSGLRLQIHDAMRVLGMRRYGELTPAQRRSGREALKEVILSSFEKHQYAARFPLFIRTLVDLGDLKSLIDVATEEWFHELGVAGGIWEALDAAASDAAIPDEQRFYALDGLVFREMRSNDDAQVERRLQAMSALIDRRGLGQHEEMVYLLKRMVFEAERGRETSAMQAMNRARLLIPDKADHRRVFRYNEALTFFLLKRFKQAQSIAEEVVRDYYGVLGLTPAAITGLSNKRIAEKLKPTLSLQDDLKHLADALDLLARSVNEQGRDSGLARVHAAKFYGLANAIDSFVKVNQDLVDEFVGRSDYIGARQIIEEHLLPAVVEAKALERILGVRSQYAVVLGYCGEYDAADAELDVLEAYRPGLSPNQCAEIDNQRGLVAELRRQGVRPGMVNATPAYLRRGKQSKVGRNELCPCGSGRKFKKCHG